MKALKRKDIEIQKLRDLCSELRGKVVKLEVENARLKKELGK
jgi:hypothetical protein